MIPRPYAVAVVKNNDTPIDNDALALIENCRGQNYHKLPGNHEIRESFHPRKIPAIW